MDKGTIGGLVVGTLLLVASVAIAPGATLWAFWDLPSVVMVFGGMIAACCVAFPLKPLLLLPKILKKTFVPDQQDVGQVITQLVQFAEIARRDGILALENRTEEIKDPFVLLGIQMAVDGTDAELIESILRSEIDAVAQRHDTGKAVLAALGKYAPAFGMIGTLVGLIIMLGNMSNPDAIGPGMAVALITTLYGAVASNMVCLPLADKLAYYNKREIEVREVILRGILSIQDGDNPRVLGQKLKAFLPTAERDKLAEAA